MSLIYVSGVSGAGKSTLVECLRSLGYEAYDADQGLCAWQNNITGEQVEYPRDSSNRPIDWQDHHSFLMSESKVSELYNKAKDRHIFICGIAPNDLLLAPTYFSHTFFLYLNQEMMVSRILSRQNNAYGQDPDQLAVIKKWYAPTVEKYTNYGAIRLDATLPVEQIAQQIIDTIKR